jgi:N-acetylglucosaminyldiphosphoundecaprenol N-acetyl-beta-D-mannosaminyltransferase
MTGQAFGVTIYGDTGGSCQELAPTPGLYIFANAYTWVSTQRREDFKKIVSNSKNKVFADGIGTSIACRMEGNKCPKRISGPSFAQKALDEWTKKPMAFIGGTTSGMAEIIRRFKLKNTIQYIPPYREVTPESFKDDIQALKRIAKETQPIEILWVCIGSPKQELWGELAKAEFPEAKIFPIGAAFHYLCGEKRRAPAWMQKIGLEWLHRLFSEPQRLLKRYLIGNTLLLYYCLKRKILNR